MSSIELENNPFTDLGKRRSSSDPVSKQHKLLIASYTVIFFMSLAIVALVMSNIYFAVFRQPLNHVLEVDKENRVTYGGALDSKLVNIDPYMPNEIIRYIENWRTVTGDNTMQKIAANRLYCMMIPETAASTRMDNYYRDPSNNPFEVNKQATRTVSIRNILQQTEKTWQVEFSETSRNHNGEVMGKPTVFKAQMVISRGTPRDACRRNNPLGTYVTDINWSNVL